MLSLPHVRTLALGAWLLLPLPGWGQTSSPAASAAVQGQRIFTQSCAFCHGADANGGAEAPSLMRSALVRHDRGGDLMTPVVRDGRPEKGMPRLGLTGEQIAAVVAFLHAQLRAWDHPSPGRPSPGHFSLKMLLTGNARAGKAYFYGAGGCSQCHSVTGDLAGIAQRVAPADLQGRFLYPIGKPATATVTLPSGTKRNGVLLHLDAFTVSIRDQQGWYHSWPLSSVRVDVRDPLAGHRHLARTMTNDQMHNLFAYLETLKP